MARHTTFGRVTALVVLGFGLSGPAAFAATEGGGNGTSLSEQEERALQIAFNEFDEDQDGSLNWENEVLPAHNGWFYDYDIDGNEEIVSEEFIIMQLHMKPDLTLDKQLAVVQQATERFKNLDPDGNEQVTRDEYFKVYAQTFAKADQNGDKQLTKEELRQYFSEQSEQDPRTPPLNEIDQVLPSPPMQDGQKTGAQGDQQSGQKEAGKDQKNDGQDTQGAQ